MSNDIPPLGAYVIDTRTDRVGQVIEHTGDLVHLHPPCSGAGWDCPASEIQATTLRAYLRARVAEVNNRRRLV
ncbi:hypothetical protein FGW37_13960 [Streptomyces rectiverticillatus]|uniref:hypothetical protein n=1 Tax=Streptomyces rectiverticillatus TaxID=173860 RepID=UPI0015C2E4FB|nr:hypothetical protein [Streptomyces rectiverticillatus]QLE72557.1 hypothetical protein FGW37_13960 [Streptomyces rectiverticillatus]